MPPGNVLGNWLNFPRWILIYRRRTQPNGARRSSTGWVEQLPGTSLALSAAIQNLDPAHDTYPFPGLCPQRTVRCWMTAFLLDMDGVLHHGERVLAGALEFVQRISDSKHLFVTNNPVRSPGLVAQQLSSLGFKGIVASQILTSAQATAAWLARQKPGFHYFAVGADGLHDALSEVGTEDRRNADYVVIGEGAGLDYESLTIGLNLVLGGATLVATNPDANVDAWRDGRQLVLPGGGALVAPFEVAAGQKAIVIGKPYPLLYRMAMERLGVGVDDCIMIGDRPDTDIAGAAALGMRSALVRTGRFLPGASWPKGMDKPGWDVDSLAELTSEFEAAGILQVFS